MPSYLKFLTAMNSLRRDVVTQFVRFFCPCVPFFSFSVLGVCSAFFLVLESFNGKGCFKEV